MNQPAELPRPKPASSRRILELDALRGLAALAVVLFHYTTRYEQLFGHSDSLVVSVPWGDFGVDLFFMLSGFVILMTLERTADSWKFAWGRFSRLYPAYWAAALLTFVVVSFCGLPGQDVSFFDALVNLTMVQALLGSPHIDGAYWSLQAELIFYVNMLLLFRLGCFRRPALTVIAWVAVAVGVQWAQGATEALWPMGASLLSKFTTIGSLKYIPLFGIGVLLYDAHRAGTHSMANRVALLVCFATLGWASGLPTFAIDVLLATLLCFAIGGRVPLLAARPLVWLGTISYTLYLTHQNIGYVVIRYLESLGVSPMGAIGAAALISLGLATCLHHAVERPSMQILRKVDLDSLTRRKQLVSVNS